MQPSFENVQVPINSASFYPGGSSRVLTHWECFNRDKESPWRCRLVLQQHNALPADTVWYLSSCIHWMSGVNNKAKLHRRRGCAVRCVRKTLKAGGWTDARLSLRPVLCQRDKSEADTDRPQSHHNDGQAGAGGRRRQLRPSQRCNVLVINCQLPPPPLCLVDRSSICIRSTHHCDSHCSSDLGHTQKCITDIYWNFLNKWRANRN